MPEFKLEFRLKVTENEVAASKAAMTSKKRLNSTVWAGDTSFQKSLKVLDFSGAGHRPEVLRNEEEENNDEQWQGPAKRSTQQPEVLLGMYHSPEEWHKKAIKLQHPATILAAVDASSACEIAGILSRSVQETIDHRKQVLMSYQALALQLQPEEDKLHAQMHEGLREVMQGKRLLLLKQVLIDAHLPFKGVMHRLTTGFEVVGSLCKPGLSEEQTKPASMTVRGLWSKAKWAHAAVMSKVKSSGDDELDSILWSETMAERDRGWLAGPFSAEEVKQRNGPLWNPNPRFALRQGAKTRMIDDLSYYSTNATVSQCEKTISAEWMKLCHWLQPSSNAPQANGRRWSRLMADPTPSRGTLIGLTRKSYGWGAL